MKVATETRSEYNHYGRTLFRCACECGYRTMWYPHKDCAEQQMAWHEQNQVVITEKKAVTKENQAA